MSEFKSKDFWRSGPRAGHPIHTEAEKNTVEQTEECHWRDSDEWDEIGQVGVDAGMIWIGDPCYLAPTDDDTDQIATSPARNWDRFVDWFCTPFRPTAQHPLGVVVRSGHGDGSYKVYAKYYKGAVAEVRIEFIDCTTGDVAFDWGQSLLT